MSTDRRKFLQGMIVSVGGASLLAACGHDPEIAVTPLVENTDGRFFNASEIQLLSRVSDLIIPRTHTPGALDVKVPAYFDGLMADWASAKTKEQHRNTIAALQLALDELVEGEFVKATEEKAVAALSAVDAASFGEGKGVPGYRGLKKMIATIYFQTEDGATLELDYQPVPGYWDPCAEKETI
ncbi:gluconate 2-dehydrogenase subunit 3 family protein [Hirschia litorea]|uniref:Gluconate 2-dehydrogenase subunit 3 family protein n=1 Tax=Hirschia litorea TaxID=1199156 RepID=A0ABW2IN86_9PROT